LICGIKDVDGRDKPGHDDVGKSPPTIKRREFITLIGGAAAAWPIFRPLPLRAQANKLARIGIIDNSPLWDHFRQGLRDLGYVEGRTVAFEYRETGGDLDRLAAAAAELAGLPVDLIAAYGTPSSRAAKRATERIPIVMVGIGDPTGSGLVASLGRPGGNITGNTVLSPDLGAKRLQLFKEAVSATRVAFLYNPDNASHAATLDELKAAAPRLGMLVITVSARRFEEFDAAFADMMRQRPDAFLMSADAVHLRHVGWVIDFLARNRLPGMFQVRENVLAGGLMSYGADLPDLFRRAAGYAHKILTGTKPGDLPIEQPTKFELVLNLKTAKALGIKVAESFVLRADEVIE
jgi:putative ABC transport system substrate-binding protein